MYLYDRTTLQLLVFFVFLKCIATADYSSGGHKKYPVPFKKLQTCQEFDIAEEECKHFFPIETFKQIPSKEYKLYLKFYVMTSNDANIVLSNALNTSVTGSVRYKAVIGGFADTYSWLKNTADKIVGIDSRIAGLLSPLWATPIVIRQRHSGELEVAIPNVVDPLLKADAADLDVKSVCFFAWRKDSRWFYNCKEDEIKEKTEDVAVDISISKNVDVPRTS